MSNLKEIKGRIASVQSTQKITSAMRMVSSAKLRRTQQTTLNFLVYQQKLQEIMESLGYVVEEDSSSSRETSAPKETSVPRGSSTPIQHVLLVPVASNSGLCGAFNSNILKATLQRKEEWEQQGATVTLMPIGKKVNHSLLHEGHETVTDYVELLDKISKEDIFPKVASMVAHIDEKLTKEHIDKVEFIYHHFKSMGTQKIQVESIETHLATSALPQNAKIEGFITEPSPAELIQTFFPRLVNAKVYGILLDSVTSEHAARMLAMQTADDNAQELTQELTLLYNKTRQQSITNELIDIMSGKANG